MSSTATRPTPGVDATRSAARQPERRLTLAMLVSFARTEPGARVMLSARPGVVRRFLAVLPSRRNH